jgi:hypothetical protein
MIRVVGQGSHRRLRVDDGSDTGCVWLSCGEFERTDPRSSPFERGRILDRAIRVLDDDGFLLDDDGFLARQIRRDTITTASVGSSERD